MIKFGILLFTLLYSRLQGAFDWHELLPVNNGASFPRVRRILPCCYRCGAASVKGVDAAFYVHLSWCFCLSFPLLFLFLFFVISTFNYFLSLFFVLFFIVSLLPARHSFLPSFPSSLLPSVLYFFSSLLPFLRPRFRILPVPFLPPGVHPPFFTPSPLT